MPNRFLTAACLILSCLPALPAFCRGDLAGWNVNDLTGTIELSAVEERDSVLTISMKNKTAEVITAVALSFREGTYYYQDWMNAEPSGLAPGQTFDVTVGAADGATRRIGISAVLFADGGGKGNLAQLDIMNVHRFGQILEGTRIRDILRNRPASADDAGISTLVHKIGKLPRSVDDAWSSLAGTTVPGIQLTALRQYNEKTRDALLWGVSTTRERALRQLENVKQLPAVSADEKTPSRAAVLAFLHEQYDAQNKNAVALLARMHGGR